MFYLFIDIYIYDFFSVKFRPQSMMLLRARTDDAHRFSVKASLFLYYLLRVYVTKDSEPLFCSIAISFFFICNFIIYYSLFSFC